MPQLAIVGQTLVELNQGLVEPILKDAHLLLNDLLVLRGSIDPARHLSVLPDLLPSLGNLVLHRLEHLFFGLDQVPVSGRFLVQFGQLILLKGRHGLLRVAHLQRRHIGLQIVVLLPQLFELLLLPP